MTVDLSHCSCPSCKKLHADQVKEEWLKANIKRVCERDHGLCPYWDFCSRRTSYPLFSGIPPTVRERCIPGSTGREWLDKYLRQEKGVSIDEYEQGKG